MVRTKCTIELLKLWRRVSQFGDVEGAVPYFAGLLGVCEERSVYTSFSLGDLGGSTSTLIKELAVIERPRALPGLF
jgi:hypothetical protein